VREHTPLTASGPGVRSYRVYTAAGPQNGEPAFDGVAVPSFDDRAAYEAAVALPEFAAAIADAPNFQDIIITTSLSPRRPLATSTQLCDQSVEPTGAV
jgi:uncharacterized protein (TIGR02118 family)